MDAAKEEAGKTPPRRAPPRPTRRHRDRLRQEGARALPGGRGRRDRVVLHGVANTQAAIDAALAAARSVPGVAEAESAIQVVQEFTVMP